MNNVKVIIPIHKFNDEISSLFSNAVESVMIQENIEELPKILVVYTKNIEDNIIGFVDAQKRKYQDKIKIGMTVNETNDTNFQSQINIGVKYVETEYFSILEFDDEFNRKYFKNVNKYIKYEPEVDIFLPIIIEVDPQGNAQKFTNEFIWAQMVVGENGEMGYFNLDAVKQNADIKISGAVIKKDNFLVIGGLKKNIELMFNYEFIIRALHNGLTVFTIPKLGYKHMIARKNSLFDKNMKLTMPERKFWYDTAIKESNFNTDRVIDLSNLYVEEKK